MTKRCAAIRLPFIISVCIWLCSGCIGRTYLVGSIVQDVVDASQQQGDLAIIQQGTPAYLMLVDGLIHSNPRNQKLLIAGARAYSTYAMLIEDENQARTLHARAKGYAIAALERNRYFAPCKEKPLSDFIRCVNLAFDEDDVSLLYWSALSWGNWIASHLDSVTAIAQLPRVEALMRRVLELDETYDYGGAHLFLGIYEATRPGGDLAQAKVHFEKGIEIGEGKLLMGYVSYAAYYAIKARDRRAFRFALKAAVKTPPDIVPELVLVNTVARAKAQELLNNEQEYFVD